MNEAFDRIGLGICKFFELCGQFVEFGFRQKPWRNPVFKWLILLPFAATCWLASKHEQFLIISLGSLAGFVVFFFAAWGFLPFIKSRKYQRKLNVLSLKAGNGTPPKVIGVKKLGNGRIWLTVSSKGIDLKTYKDKMGTLASAFEQEVEEVRKGKNPSFVDILLNDGVLPKLVQFSKLKEELDDPYSFVVGESWAGNIFQSLPSLPHLLIAGTTGAGKSNFFKVLLVSLLRSSKAMQLYALDLKQGVEMRAFKGLPNTTVCGTASDAVHILRLVKKEMERRYKLLEKNGHEKIDPERDKLDRIIVGIDEASILYGATNKSSADYSLIQEAKDLTENIAKLGRAAGISLIFATQKVSAKTIPTVIQENVTGRMVFRQNTMPGSLLVLGNKNALELPGTIPGRAIWTDGTSQKEVQVPLIESEEIKKEIELVKTAYEKGQRRNYSAQLDKQMEDKAKVTDKMVNQFAVKDEKKTV